MAAVALFSDDETAVVAKKRVPVATAGCAGGPFRLTGTESERHKPNCLCCIGPPDHAFERACAAVAALEIEGVGKPEAEKFVRLLCRAGATRFG